MECEKRGKKNGENRGPLMLLSVDPNDDQLRSQSLVPIIYIFLRTDKSITRIPVILKGTEIIVEFVHNSGHSFE